MRARWIGWSRWGLGLVTIAVGMVAGCGSSNPAPGVAVLRDTADTAGRDVAPGPDTAAVDTGPETVACVADEACKAAFPDVPPCRVPRCVEGACALAGAEDGARCGVDDPCWIDGTCAGGACVGTRVDCDDGNPCTADDCASELGCFYEILDGGACDDRKPWTVDDHCEQGRCVGDTGPCECEGDADCAALDDGDGCNGVPVCRECVCTDGPPVACDTSGDDECGQTGCDPASGACVRHPVADGVRCDDGSRCTDDDRCLAGRCEGAVRDCDDENPCTNDACDPRAGCLHFENAATCDDDDFCTRNDACIDGYCVGTRRSCDDGDACTLDSCDPAEGCRNAPATGGSCDDRFACTEADVCEGGLCVGTENACVCETDVDCVAWGDGDLCHGTLTCVEGRCEFDPEAVVTCPPPDPDGCVRHECVPASGTCEPFAVDDGADCDDGDACTTGDRCQAGACLGGDVDCDDGNPCTDDRCDRRVGCAHDDNLAPCDDGNACTVQSRCAAGVCGGGSARVCDDGERCTRDSCDVETGCRSAPLTGTACDDGDACSVDDRCKEGVCVSLSSLICADERPCTLDFCDPVRGCVFEPDDGARCDDLDPCTTGDVCVGADCVGPGQLDCDDENPCTADTCVAGAGCAHTPATHVPCDDRDPCTTGDRCVGGECVGGEATCDCTVTADCAPLEDGDRCNGTLVCDTKAPPYRCVVDPATVVVCDASGDTACRRNRCQPADGVCRPEPVREGLSCDDGDVCTVDDVCGAGDCVPGDSAVCNDRNPCTDDTCDPISGCAYEPNTSDCSDGNACTDGDRCADAVCVPGDPVPCDDGDVCTIDRCDPQDGCVHTPSSEPCDDGDACTTDDTCVDSACVGGPPPVCDDGEICTSNECDPDQGCVFPPQSGPCDDEDPCTAGDRCLDGACTPEAAIDCSDGDPCTADLCGADGGCTHVVLPYGTWCDDGDASTVADQCLSGGVCAGWLHGEVFRAGARNTLLTDVTWSRFVVGFSLIDTVYVTGSDRIDNQSWTWVGRLGSTTLFVSAGDQFQGDTLTDLSYRMAIGARGLVLRHDGSGWRTSDAIDVALALPAGATLLSVHGYWKRRLLDSQAMTAETFYVGGTAAGGGPLLWRCEWDVFGILPAREWVCTQQTVPAGGGVGHVWGTRTPAVLGGDYVDARAWAGLQEGSDAIGLAAGALASAAGGSDTWSEAAPNGCSGLQGTACAGAQWHDLSGAAGEMWAVGADGRLMRNTGLGWVVVAVPSSALWGNTTLSAYQFKAVGVSATRGVHIAGEWTGCLDGPCDGRAATHKRLFFLHYDPQADRWDGVRELLLAQCPGPTGGTVACVTGWLDRYEIVALTLVESASPEVVVIGNRPLASADGQTDSAGLVFHLHAD